MKLVHNPLITILHHDSDTDCKIHVLMERHSQLGFQTQIILLYEFKVVLSGVVAVLSHWKQTAFHGSVAKGF